MDMNQTDEQLLAAFNEAAPEAREHFLALYGVWQRIPAEARVHWTPMRETAPNTYTMGYPDYSPEYYAVTEALHQLHAIAPHDWMDRKTDYSYRDAVAVAQLPLPELFRLMFRVKRMERFSEGTESEFIESGGFDALLDQVAAALQPEAKFIG